MRKFVLTLQYLFKIGKDMRFFILFLFAFPSAALMAYFFPISGFYDVLLAQKLGEFSSYGDLWLMFAGRNSLQFMILAVAFVLLTASVSLMTTLITRSMRVGKFQMHNPLYLINENVFPALAISTSLIVASFATHSLISLFIFLWYKLFGAGIAAYAISITTVLIVLIIFAFGASALILWLPIMTYYGLTPPKAFALALKKFYPYSKEFFSTYLIILVLVLLFGFLGFLVQGVRWATWLLNAVGYTLATEFLVTFCIVAFFDTEGIEREDLAKKPYLRR